jgi:hypothetical protein
MSMCEEKKQQWCTGSETSRGLIATGKYGEKETLDHDHGGYKASLS